MKVFISVLISLFATFCIALTSAHAEGYEANAIVNTDQAHTSDSIVDMLGLDTHFDYDTYKLTPTFFEDVLRPAVLELGVRHLHDSTGEIGSTTSSYTSKLKSLSDSGIDFILTINPQLWMIPIGSNEYPNPLMQKLRALQLGGVVSGRTFNGPINILAYQLGPNEYDHAPQNTWNGRNWKQAVDAYRGSNWMNDLLAYNQSAYPGIKSDPVTSLVPQVIAVPLVHVDEYATTPGMEVLANLGDYADVGNAHVYCHHRGPFDCLNRNFHHWENFYPGKPVWISEFGYSNANHVSGVSESKATKLFLRSVFEFANRGIKKAYYYSMLDEAPAGGTTLSDLYGIMRRDGTKKPVFYTFKNLISILKDPGSQSSPGTLQYTIDGANSNLHRRLLQKRSGEFYLALWNELTTSTEADQVQTVSLSFNTAMDISVYDPRVGSTPQRQLLNTTGITLTIPDSVLLVAIKPNVPPTPTPIPTLTPSPAPSPTITTTPNSRRNATCSVKTSQVSKCKRQNNKYECVTKSKLSTTSSPILFTLERLSKNADGALSWKSTGKRFKIKNGASTQKLKSINQVGKHRLASTSCTSSVFRLR